MRLERKYCLRCHEPKLAIAEPPNHLYWFLVTLVTFGFGLIFWIIACVSEPKIWHCLTCGSKNVTKIPSETP